MKSPVTWQFLAAYLEYYFRKAGLITLQKTCMQLESKVSKQWFDECALSQ